MGLFKSGFFWFISCYIDNELLGVWLMAVKIFCRVVGRM